MNGAPVYVLRGQNVDVEVDGDFVQRSALYDDLNS